MAKGHWKNWTGESNHCRSRKRAVRSRRPAALLYSGRPGSGVRRATAKSGGAGEYPSLRSASPGFEPARWPIRAEPPLSSESVDSRPRPSQTLQTRTRPGPTLTSQRRGKLSRDWQGLVTQTWAAGIRSSRSEGTSRRGAGSTETNKRSRGLCPMSKLRKEWRQIIEGGSVPFHQTDSTRSRRLPVVSDSEDGLPHRSSGNGPARAFQW